MGHDHDHSHDASHDAGHDAGHGHAFADMLDLDAEVLHDHHHEVIAWAGSLVGAGPRIVDLGAGTGTGTLALARHLPDAHLTAVDLDADLLARVDRRAADAGVADRVRTVRADLDGDWPDLGPVDLVWASASMHHLADPARTLAQVHAVLRPGGAILITELDSFPRFLTDPAGVALEDRCHAELARRRLEHGMHMGLNWGTLLKAAGFEVESERRFDIELRPPLPAQAVRYARVSLQRMRHGLADHLGPDDLDALDRLSTTVVESDLTVRTVRTAWAARRP
jgi:SAM-dependent methyltransferase